MADLVPLFCELTGASPQQATEYLAASQDNVEAAVAAFFADQDESAASGPAPSSQSAQAPAEPEYSGPRTLDGRPAPQWTPSSSSSAAAGGKRPPKRTGLATLSSLGGGHNHDDDDDEDDDDEGEDERRGPRDLFAGGEKSGLAVQDPAQRSSSDSRKLIDDIVAKAKANSHRPDTTPVMPPGPRQLSRFRGTGQTVGGDGVESRTIPDPQGQPIPTVGAPQPDGAVQERVLHLWQDGFSIDDGPLHRFDDPANRTDLQMIRQGRAPLHLMNVRLEEPVGVKLQQHHENYHPLPKVYRPFGGEGRRLGSPVPGEAVASASISAPSPSSSAAAASTAPASSAPSTGVDESQPTLTLRIQMPDGTRMPARFNTSQTVGDIYEFVTRASPSVSSRAWVLATTFPNKEHTDHSLVLGEMAEFKKGGTAVVKWA